MTEDGALYSWGAAPDTEIDEVSEENVDKVPAGLGHTNMLDKHVTTRIAPHLMQ